MKIVQIALALGVTSALAACGGGSSSSSSSSSSDSASAATGGSAPPAAPGTANCVYLADPSSNTGGKKPDLPPGVASTTANYTATVVTDHGTIVIALDATHAPCTVNSFVSLAKQGFYDNTICHRLLNESVGNQADAVLQCGDPTGTGAGGPGYSFPDENLAGASYPKGEVAMANAGPNTNGSQFFMMFKDSTFQPNYTPFGKILSGVDVLTKIAAGGTHVSPDGSSDAPNTKTTIKKVTVSGGAPTASATPDSKSATPVASNSATPQ